MRKSVWAQGTHRWVTPALLLALLGVWNAPCYSAARIAPPPAYSLDAAKHVITIHNTGDVTAEINSALSYLVNRPDKNTPWTMRFDGGQYAITKILFSERLQNVALQSDPRNPAILTKADNASIEYLFYTRFSKNISMSGFTFIGKTPTYIPANYTTSGSIGWQDQGIYFGSSNGVIITNNRFYNIGNAAIRVTTTERDPVPGVNSFNTQITKNYFDNIYQISTTSNDTIHGGTSNLLLQDNTFDHIWGSVKFASRTAGANNVTARNNKINNSANDGFEIVGYNNVDISGNTIQNVTRNAVNSYTNSVSREGFEWGDNISFRNNRINKTGGGIRLSADPYMNGYKPKMKNVTISGNSITNLTGNFPALTLLKSDFPGLNVSDNKFSNIPSKTYVYMPMKNLGATMRGNLLDTKLLKLF
jgi:hypothetical protein